MPYPKHWKKPEDIIPPAVVKLEKKIIDYNVKTVIDQFALIFWGRALSAAEV